LGTIHHALIPFLDTLGSGGHGRIVKTRRALPYCKDSSAVTGPDWFNTHKHCRDFRRNNASSTLESNISTLYEAHKPAVSVLRLTPIIFGARTLDE